MHCLCKLVKHWHRLAQYGLEVDMEYCVKIDVANVLPIYKGNALVIEN